MQFPPLDPWQFRLSKSASPAARALGSVWLETGADLPVTEVLDSRGKPTGVILGFALDLAARTLLASRWQAPAVFDRATPDDYARSLLPALGGRFLLVLAADGIARVYPDVAAQVSCVFDSRTGSAGSTTTALLDDESYGERFNDSLYERLGVEGEGWFPAGLTAHRDIHRLLPGHCLDLETGRVHRFWPSGDIETCADTDAVVEETIDLVRCQFEALLSGDRRLGLALTAGHETRFLLACARPYLDRIDFVTVVGGDRHATDTVIARRIARKFGLNHIELRRTTATAEQRRTFIRRGGHCYADSNSRFHPSVWPIAQSHVFAGGLGGEYGRAFLWREKDTPETQITARLLNNRLGLPEDPVVLASLERWLKDLDTDNALSILDLAYNENRMGPWSSAQFCCDPTLVRHAPLLTFRGVELMFSLPPEWKRSSRLGNEIIRRLWPELAAISYNSLGPWRDLVITMQRVLSNPRVIAKKLRKMRG